MTSEFLKIFCHQTYEKLWGVLRHLLPHYIESINNIAIFLSRKVQPLNSGPNRQGIDLTVHNPKWDNTRVHGGETPEWVTNKRVQEVWYAGKIEICTHRYPSSYLAIYLAI